MSHQRYCGSFILGTSRSGSTLLASLLNSHPEVTCTPETWWLPIANELGLASFNNQFALNIFLNRIGNNIAAGPDGTFQRLFLKFRDHLGSFRGAYLDLLACFADFVASETGKRIFLEKTPAHTTYLFEITSKRPDFGQIIIIRDPRDVVASYFDTWLTPTLQHLIDVLITLKVYFWNIEHYHAEHALFVSYETLTQNPQSELDRIYHYLGASRVNVLSLPRKPTACQGAAHKHIGEQVFPNSGKFDRLEPEFVAYIEKAMEQELTTFGYSLLNRKVEIDPELVEIVKRSARSHIASEAKSKNSTNWRPHYLRQAKVYLRNWTRPTYPRP
jgi:hypothetical protein